MNKDPLKDLFQEAFDKEHIPFDPAAWDQMNLLLNQQVRRRFLWIGFGGMGGFTLLTLLTFLFFTGTSAIYQPRGSAFTVSETPKTPASSSQPFHEPEGSKQTSRPTGSEDATTLTPKSSSSLDIASRPNTQSNIDSTEPNQLLASNTAGSVSAEGTPAANTASVGNNSADALTPPVQTADTTARTTAELPSPWNIPPDVLSSFSSRRDINPINRIVWEGTPNPAGTFESRTLESPPSLRNTSQFYLRVGLSRNFMLNTGQVGGIGYERQLAEHFLVSAELNLTRDHTYFNYTQTRTVHGFDQYNRALRIWASEMIHTELPILLRLRWNRMTLGSGITLGRLWSSQVTEESLDLSEVSTAHKQPVGEQTDMGYVNWSELRALQIALPIDFQYQLDERYGMGVRYQYGLKDAFTITQMTDRLNRLEFYLKISLNP